MMSSPQRRRHLADKVDELTRGLQVAADRADDVRVKAANAGTRINAANASLARFAWSVFVERITALKAEIDGHRAELVRLEALSVGLRSFLTGAVVRQPENIDVNQANALRNAIDGSISSPSEWLEWQVRTVPYTDAARDVFTRLLEDLKRDERAELGEP
jgi:hypothetical protein